MTRKIRSLALVFVVAAAVPVTASEQRSPEPLLAAMRSISSSGFIHALVGYLMPGEETAGDLDGRGTRTGPRRGVTELSRDVLT